MRWAGPSSADDFEELTFEYSPEELGIDAANAAKIQEIKRLRPLSPNQPWGIFFVKFEPKQLPVVALRRILSQVALKKRASANSAERAAWAADDLLFISNYGLGEERQISFAHFSKSANGHDLPTLKVLGWDNLDTALHLDAVAKGLDSSSSLGPMTTPSRSMASTLACRIHPSPRRSCHDLKGPFDSTSGTRARHPRPHQDSTRHRDRGRSADQANEGIPGGAGPRPGR